MHKEDKTMKTQLLKVSEESDRAGRAGSSARASWSASRRRRSTGWARTRWTRTPSTEIFEAKGRPQDNPLITHVSCVEEIPPLVRAIPDAARKADGGVLARTDDADPAQGGLHSPTPSARGWIPWASACPSDANARALIARRADPSPRRAPTEAADPAPRRR